MAITQSGISSNEIGLSWHQTKWDKPKWTLDKIAIRQNWDQPKWALGKIWISPSGHETKLQLDKLGLAQMELA